MLQLSFDNKNHPAILLIGKKTTGFGIAIDSGHGLKIRAIGLF